MFTPASCRLTSGSDVVAIYPYKSATDTFTIFPEISDDKSVLILSQARHCASRFGRDGNCGAEMKRQDATVTEKRTRWETVPRTSGL